MIEIKNLVKKYGDKVVYNGLNLKIEEGKTIAVLGESGSGKTTLLNVLANLTDFEGQITGLPEKISVVFQKNRLVPNLTVKENVTLVNPMVDAVKILKDLGLEGVENALPKSLSAGMARRVAIASAMAFEAPLILMDEPFINLDLGLKYTLLNRLKELVKSRSGTLVVVTHDVKEATQIADRIVVVADGKIVCDIDQIKENTEKQLFGIMMDISKEKLN